MMPSGSKGASSANKAKTLFKCRRQNCAKRFVREKHRDNHERAVHDRIPKFKCPETNCGKSFNYDSDLSRHWRQKHSSDPEVHQCPNCEKAYTRNTNLRQHMKTHQQTQLEEIQASTPIPERASHTGTSPGTDQEVSTSAYYSTETTSPSAPASSGFENLLEQGAGNCNNCNQSYDRSASPDGCTREAMLSKALQHANRKIHDLQRELEALKGKGQGIRQASSQVSMPAESGARNPEEFFLLNVPYDDNDSFPAVQSDPGVFPPNDEDNAFGFQGGIGRRIQSRQALGAREFIRPSLGHWAVQDPLNEPHPGAMLRSLGGALPDRSILLQQSVDHISTNLPDGAASSPYDPILILHSPESFPDSC